MHNKKDNNKTNAFIQGLRPFSKSLPYGVKRLLRKGSYNFSNIVDNWAKMVGKDLSNACYPSTVKMGKEMKPIIISLMHTTNIRIKMVERQKVTAKQMTMHLYPLLELSRIQLTLLPTLTIPNGRPRIHLTEQLVLSVDVYRNVSDR